MKRIFTGSLFIIFLSSGLKSQSSNYISFSTGLFGVLDKNPAGMVSLEFQLEENNALVNPLFGLIYTTKSDFITFVGANLNIPLIDNFKINFNFAPGLYYSFKRNLLGHVIEFNSGVNLIYIFENQNRLILSFHHISNGGLGKYNPGIETLAIIYSIPI